MNEQLIIKGARPRIVHIKNEPLPNVSWDQFWQVWDKLMHERKFTEANIFLQQRYDKRWNKGYE